jgi:hypothetical protein
MAARFVDDRDEIAGLRDLTRPEVRHLPRNAGRQALRVRIDVLLDVLVALRARPRMIWNSPIGRIDDDGDRGTKSTG